MKNDAPQIFQRSLLFFTGGHFVFRLKASFFFISWRAELLVEIEPTPRVNQGSWWRMGLHQESTKALGGDLAYTKSPPRLLVEI